MTPTRSVFVALLLLIAMAAPQFVATTSGASESPDGEHSGRTRVEDIDEGLEPGDSGDGVEALQEYLGSFGYMRSRTYQSRNFDTATKEALKEFQRNFKISPTGRVDGRTHDLITAPRYDNHPDVAANGDPQVDNYVLYGTSWDDPNLTYAYDDFTNDLSQSAQKSAMEQALAAWAEVTPLTFTEVSMNQNPEIVISFESGNHGDGSQNAFDGAGGILAHAFYPPNTDPSGMSLHGDAHFDDAETWTVTIPVPGGGIDLVTVAIHEFGHSLGLGHSNNSNAIMAPFYTGANRTLHSDDVSGIQSLYGSGGGGGNQTVDAEVLSITMSPSSTTVGNAVSGTVSVRNNGDQAAAIPVIVTGPSGFSYNTTTASVGSGSSTAFNFSWTPGASGNFTLTATSNLNNDGNAGNNSKTSNTVNVSQPQQTVDAQVTSASASPTSITQNSGNVTISATIRNNGSSTATIPVSVSGPSNWSSATSRTLASNSSTTVQFSWPASALGTHNFTVSTSLSGDSNAANNSKTTNSVTVSNTPAGNKIFVNGINLSATSTGTSYNLQAVVTIGPNASAGSGAYMYGYWISPQNQYRFAYGYANSSGQLTLNTTTNVTGAHKFQIYYVGKTGMQYDSSQNVGNPATVNAGGGSQPTIDASVNAVSANPTSIALNGGNVTISATIGNNGDNAASIPVNISGPSGYSSSQNVSVGAGGTQQVSFSWPASVAGGHTFTVSTSLSGDSNSGNNQRTSPTVNVTQSTVVDAAVQSLSRSTDSVEQNGPAVTFTANVSNTGSNSATFTVRLSSGSAAVNMTKSVTLASGGSQNVSFQWNPTVVGNHSFTATAELSGDSNAGNNSKSTSVNVTQPGPSSGDDIFIEKVSIYKFSTIWYVYFWIDSSNGQASSGAVVTATVRAASGQTKQLTATTGYASYSMMRVTSIGSGAHTLTFDNISLSGYTYAPSMNSQTTVNLPS